MGAAWTPPPRIRRLQDLNEMIAGTSIRQFDATADGIDWEAVHVDWLNRTAAWRAERDAIHADMLEAN